jgi:hypothetical protein
MKNQDKPAFPVTPYREIEQDIERGFPFGLTKREYFASQALIAVSMGLPASAYAFDLNQPQGSQLIHKSNISDAAVELADSLLKRLEE